MGSYTGFCCIYFFFVTQDDFQIDSVDQLHKDLAVQGDTVSELLYSSLECFLRGTGDPKKIEAEDVEIDKVDIQIERRSVKLLAQINNDLDLRNILTIVKVNNEFERIADRAVEISLASLDTKMRRDIPEPFEVVANNVIGLVRESVSSFRCRDALRAESVLRTDDAAGAFDEKISKEIISLVQKRKIGIDMALNLSHAARSLQRISDHCTNVCEQVIYVESGKIVRHSQAGWTAPIDPDA